jgi:antibiotic biosynthesis monooxygenase (ABM) superfamily enzyme
MEKGGVDATDYTTPFTVFYVFKVPRNRVLQFEEWVQGTIVCQSRGFPGYKGTLLYRPESASGSGDATYLLDCRYRGANNLKSWLMSDQRDLLYSQVP